MMCESSLNDPDAQKLYRRASNLQRKPCCDVVLLMYLISHFHPLHSSSAVISFKCSPCYTVWNDTKRSDQLSKLYSSAFTDSRAINSASGVKARFWDHHTTMSTIFNSLGLYREYHISIFLFQVGNIRSDLYRKYP